MKAYWKVKTPYERQGSDLVALYGARRYFATAQEAEYRCQELNEAHDQSPEKRGTFSFVERFIFNDMPEDGDAAKVELGL